MKDEQKKKGKMGENNRTGGEGGEKHIRELFDFVDRTEPPRKVVVTRIYLAIRFVPLAAV